MDTPIFRIPFTKNPPTIDGPMKEGEWQDASALSGFWYDFAAAKFLYLAPKETQLEVYGAYDKENLYIAYTSPVYPPGSWLKARGRFPDVTHHPRFGIIWDDHIELEIRPYHDNVKGFRLGLFKWFVNPTATVADLYWSQKGGEQGKWLSQMKAQCNVTPDRWTLEMAIPLERLVHGAYAGQEKDGEKYVKLPPPPGTAYRVWFTRGIGGNGGFYNAFDNHVWNTTKTKMILDPDCVSFQINELGPIMEDIIDVQMTVKNHSKRSQTLRLGFFAESAAGTIYSSYESGKLSDGLLELVPGEVREIRLKKPFPGITTVGNTLWFDVRTAGRPAKPVFMTRLIDFHSQDADLIPEDGEDFKSRRIDVIEEELRPPRQDFDFTYNYSKFSNRISGIVDIGIYGASKEAKRAVEAKLTVLDRTKGGEIVISKKEPFTGNFATFLFDMPKLTPDHTYTVSVLLFDENKRIVGEDKSNEFTPGNDFKHAEKMKEKGKKSVDIVPVEEWKHNKIGLDDVVWEPFTEMKVGPDGFETLKHRFDLADSGLPQQIYIKPNAWDLPLEERGQDSQLEAEELQKIGRGPQLRRAMRLVVKAGDERYPAKVTKKARLVKEWKSELEYESELQAGPLDVKLHTRYDCDGSMHCSLTYGADRAVQVDGFELVTDVGGPVNLVASGISGAGMAGSDRWECTLPHTTGVVWDSANIEPPDLFYSQFVPFIFFGTGDRGFTWYASSDRYWELDRDGSSMTLSRNARGEVTWRVKFVNHTSTIEGHQTLQFHVLTHPAKPKPKNYRKISWLYRGDTWALGYQVEPIELSEEVLKERWRFAASAPKDLPFEKADTWRKESAPWRRFGRWRNMGVAPGLGYRFEQRLLYYFERQIRVGRRHGYWWDEYWPGFGRSDNLAEGNSYLRDPEDVREKELLWQSGFTADHMRRAQKRLARVSAKNNVPQRQYHWANNAATLYESVAWDCQLVEECGAGHRSFALDIVTQFPSSLWRYESHHFTGLVTRVVADHLPTRAGDDLRHERQYLGRALLNDIGVCFDGPHGRFRNVEQGIRLINELTEFGFFEGTDTELIPYWRNEHIVRLGEGRRQDSHLSALSDQLPRDHLYVTAYR
ncbi:MAG: hypothetical protein KGZ25_10990, partial [Planctomycetes bacterium]|nr:hypothetical protein [Planctomycetota bacterium]